MKAMLEPSIVAARIHGPAFPVHGTLGVAERIDISSQGAFIKRFPNLALSGVQNLLAGSLVPDFFTRPLPAKGPAHSWFPALRKAYENQGSSSPDSALTENTGALLAH
jgi:hypothetical protein